MISSVHQQRYQPSGSNNNVDIKFSAKDVSSKPCDDETLGNNSHQQWYKHIGSNNNVDIKFSANDASSKPRDDETLGNNSHQQWYKLSGSNNNVDIQFIAHDAFLDSYSSLHIILLLHLSQYICHSDPHYLT